MNSRPIYETDADLARERAAVQVFCKVYGCTARKLPISYGLDYSLIGKTGHVTGMVEVKCRTNHSQMYDTIFISLLKRVKALEMRRAAGVATLFLPVYTDGVYMIDFNEKPDFITYEGRKDRGDTADQEPMIHYKVDRLRFIGSVESPSEIVS
jgi:hypothetical protein